MQPAALLQFACRLPKVELHVHLEGAIRPATLLELARRNQVDLPFQDLRGADEFYRFRDFEHFIAAYLQITGCLRTPEDYTLIAAQFGADCARQNTRYAEVTFTMETNQRMTGLPWQAILAGLNRGRAQAWDEFGVELRWIFDINRNHPETQAATLEMALGGREAGVVALGLGGSEAGFPAGLFVETFDRAHAAGLPCIPHAGENAGPESVWAAIDRLHAVRVGHGVRSIEDPALVEALRRRRIPLEVCPTSNVKLGIYPSYAAHPFRRLWEAGLVLTVNSDDPPMFNTDLNGEYAALVEQFGFGPDELEQVSLNGVRSSLLPPAGKASLEAEFAAEFHRLREELDG